MGFDGKSIDKHHISIFILLFVYWVNNAYLFEISRFHYKERAYICMCMYVYVYMYVYMYICVFRSDPIRSDSPIRSRTIVRLILQQKKDPAEAGPVEAF